MGGEPWMKRWITVFVLSGLALGGCVERRSRRTAPRQVQREQLSCDVPQSQYGARSLRLLTNSEYQRTVQDLVGIGQDLTSDFPREVRMRGMANVTENSVITEAHAAAFMKAGTVVAAKVASDSSRFVPCNGGEDEEACARRFIQIFGKKAFRGPLDDGETNRLMTVFRAIRPLKGNFASGIEGIVQAMLMAPRFLYRFELGESKDGAFELNAWELAQALSYTYWGTMPDARLMDLAERNQLKKSEVLAEETRRLLESPKSRPILGEFAARWLGAEGVLGVNKDTGKYPEFSSTLREKFLQETKDFFTEAVLDRNGGFETLFTADFTIGDEELARHYGGQKQGAIIRLPAGERLGLLGHASVLAAYSDAGETAPVKRGLFALEHIFCEEIPSPPSSLNVMPPARNPASTTRERFAAHSTREACAGCHVKIDGAGFGLEDMDAVGRFRVAEAGRPVDSSGAIFSAKGEKRSFRGTAALGRLASVSPEAQLCFVKQVNRYVSGHKESAEDHCAADALYRRFASQDYNLKKLFLSLPLQDSFQKRLP